jgi:spore germination cell wall hydrolase CwlJ-like protein
MTPKPIVTLQYVTPWVKAVSGFLALAVFGFVCFLGGNLWQHEQRIITVPIELPISTTDDLQTEPTDFDSVSEPVVTSEEDYFIKTQMIQTRQSNWPPENLEEELTCLALNIYFEARSESRRGKIAVGLVTLNRVKSGRWPDTICGVVWQKRRNQQEKWVAQFSWTWDGKGDTPREEARWEEAKSLAGAMIAEGSLDNFVDFTHGSTHYHADYVDPWWGERLLQAGYRAQQIDTHIFYTSGEATF